MKRLQALHRINGELKIAEAKNKEYANLVEKKEMLHQEMKEINDIITGL